MQRYFTNNLENNLFKLNLDDTYHITKVMRMKIGDLIEIIYNEKLFISSIEELNPFVLARIKEVKDTYNELPLKVTICQSLVKENKMDLILQKGVELGAYDFIPLITKNSIVKDDKDFNKKIVRWQRIVKEASEQSKRNIIPVVHNLLTINELIKEEYDVKVLCTVNEMSRSLKNILQNNRNCGTMIIVIGPEGGFKKDEEELLIANGYLSTTLLDFVLRTETASITALSMINYEFKR